MWSGPFSVADAVTLDQVEAAAGSDALDAALKPLELALQGLPELPATDEGAVRLRNGNPGDVTRGVGYGEEAWASWQGRAIAVGQYRGGMLHPARVFV
jgi:tRNA pseudouridine55 synthase